MNLSTPLWIGGCKTASANRPLAEIDIVLVLLDNCAMKEVTKDEITEAIFKGSRRILNEEGITDKLWAQRLKKLVKAKKTDTFKATTKEFDGNVLVSQTEEVIYSRPMDALEIQLKAAIHIGNLLGHVVAEKKEITGKDGGPLDLITNVTGPWDKKPDAD